MNLYLLIYGPPALGALVAFLLSHARGRFTLFRPGLAGAFGIAAALTVIASNLATLGFHPVLDLNRLFMDGVMAQTLTPLLLGVAGCLIIAITPAQGARGTAELTRRSMVKTGPRGWFAAAALTLMLIVVTTIWTGSLSSPDEQGRYRHFEIHPSASFSAGSGIYGWYYSKWAALIIVALLVLGAWRLWRITSGPGTDASRAAHNRIVLALIAGALLLHLAEILLSLSGAGVLQGSTTISGEHYTFQSSLAALRVPLLWAGNVVHILGWGAWFTVLFSPAPTALARQSSAAAVSEAK